jgi:hypothetical protein
MARRRAEISSLRREGRKLYDWVWRWGSTWPAEIVENLGSRRS